MPPGSLPPGSVIISNMEVVTNPITIDSFIAEIGEMEKEGKRNSMQGESQVQSDANHQHKTAGGLQERIKSGEIIISEML